jgi:1-pyrroline-4-hydroxy-2-carboxylate deaminase
VQQEVGWGSERVRPPRLALSGDERERALALIRERLASRRELEPTAVLDASTTGAR